MSLIVAGHGRRRTQVGRILLQRLAPAALALVAATGLVAGAEKLPKSHEAAVKSATAAKPHISALQARFLVRSILLTVNDANLTGNYSVLRDIAHPALREKNTQADLALAFADLRRQSLDLAAVALLEPEFAQALEIGKQQTLRLKGAYATRPLQIAFDLTFVQAGQSWRVAAISVGLAPPAAQAPPAVTLRSSLAD